MLVKDKIHKILVDSLNLAVENDDIEKSDFPEIRIEYPREEKFGDYATPFALESAKILRRSPLEIGEILKEQIEKSNIIEKVDVVKPGFINIFLSLDSLFETLNQVLSECDSFGYGNYDKRKINLEFVSANPTGPLNIVSARAAALGDTLANLLKAIGCSVEKEFYINDYGNQVNLLGKSVLCRYRELSGEIVDFPEDGYHGEYVKDIAQSILDNFSDEIEKLENEDHLIAFMAEKAIEYNVQGQKKDLHDFNVQHDIWFREKTLHGDGSVQKALEHLESLGVIYLNESKKVFNSTIYGDDKDRVVVRDDGTPTYFMADIAYHRNKIDRGYDTILDIWGPDHHGYISRVAGAMKAQGYSDDRFKVLIAQQVNLLQEGETVKMSKRLGTFSTMNELIEEIGVDVARYFFVMRSMDSHLDFDLTLAKKESSENPVFYLQYAHARICSIFSEAEKKGFAYEPEKADSTRLNHREGIAILKMMVKFPEEIYDAALCLEPHRITNYLLKFAQLYHKFYTVHRVLSDDPVTRNTHLSLCRAVKIIIRNGLKILGVSAPEKM